MYYKSTRNSGVRITSAEAIVQGISEEGGLFVPEEIPALTMNEIIALGNMSYSERAAFVFSKYLTDFTADEIRYCTSNAYSTKNFDTENIAELKQVTGDTYVLELWHGPTCAFKDMALQILPYLLTVSVKKIKLDKKVVILVATSGDTGKAALEGFADVPDTEIMVFYPKDGVSAMQKRQMTTQSGKNVNVCALKGNFDDCQNGVKKIFTDAAVKKQLDDRGMMFSSANSINWGRLAPQIIYYLSSYAELVKKGRIKAGEKVNVAVPTGNFGNILAAYYAKKMGMPVNKLICASNSNNVLTDFLATGIYDRNRSFYTTISPSMDILISSNLERLLYLMTDYNDTLIKDWFGSLAKRGRYEVNEDVKAMLRSEFAAGFCDDDATRETIKNTFEKYNYTLDTHTAVAFKVYLDYRNKTGDDTKTIIASTASPFKFGAAVLGAVEGREETGDDYLITEKLAEKTGMTMPRSLAELKNKEVRFTECIAPDEQEEYVLTKLR